MKALPCRNQNSVAILIKLCVGLLQDVVAGHAAGTRPSRAAGAVGRVILNDTVGAIVLLLVHQSPGTCRLDHLAAMVVKTVRSQASAGDAAGALVDVVHHGLIGATLVV